MIGVLDGEPISSSGFATNTIRPTGSQPSTAASPDSRSAASA